MSISLNIANKGERIRKRKKTGKMKKGVDKKGLGWYSI